MRGSVVTCPYVRLWPLRLHSRSAQSSTRRSRKAGWVLRSAASPASRPPPKALAVAASAHRASEAVLLYVVPGDPDLETAAGDVRFFLGALEGLSDAAAERAVLPFPSHQVDPYRGLAPHFRVASARARALHAAALGAARVIVASAQAVLPRLPAPESIVATSFDLRPGVEIDPHALAEILVEGGYERQDPVDEHGEFSLRGGILDVYPAGETSPVRIEFIGDTVESIRHFDPGTQRSIETLDQFQIVPVRESSPVSANAQAATRSGIHREFVRLPSCLATDAGGGRRASRRSGECREVVGTGRLLVSGARRRAARRVSPKTCCSAGRKSRRFSTAA